MIKQIHVNAAHKNGVHTHALKRDETEETNWHQNITLYIDMI